MKSVVCSKVVDIREPVILGEAGASEKVIKNVYFSGKYLDRNQADCFINIMGDVKFVNCVFISFPNTLIQCTENARVTFNNCYFENIYDGVKAFDNAKVIMNNCKFHYVKSSCLVFCNNSSFEIKWLKIRGIEGIGISIQDYSHGSIGESSIVGSNSNKTTSFGIISSSNNKINIYKSSLCRLGIAINCTKSSQINLMDCIFKNNINSILLVGNSNVSIFSTSISFSSEICICCSNSTSLKIYDSKFSDNSNVCIITDEKAEVHVYSSCFKENIGNCLRNCSAAKASFYDCEICECASGGLYIKDESFCDVARCKIYDNDLGNIIIADNAEGNFENTEIYYSKRSDYNLHPVNINMMDSGKGFFNQVHVFASEKNMAGIEASDNSVIFVKDSLFETLDYIAVYEDKSEIYLSDSLIKDIYQTYAIGNDTAKFSVVRCNYKGIHDESLREVQYYEFE